MSFNYNKYEWKRETRITRTNWTFGIWWGKIGRSFCIGIDLGPLETIWKRAWLK